MLHLYAALAEKEQRLIAERTRCHSACKFDPLSRGIGVQN
jgi:hypothetical protein